MKNHFNIYESFCELISKDAVCNRPKYLVIVTLVVVFVAEAVVMLILRQTTKLNIYVEALLDAVLLSAIIYPLLYILLFRPLSNLVDSYRQSLLEVKTLRGLLSICMKCNKILVPGGNEYDQTDWQRVETYIEEHSETEFSHGLCPECYKKWRIERGLSEIDT
ncbi:MAG: hypothetical protein ACK2TU_01855 [Anaerolineales bacterium]